VPKPERQVLVCVNSRPPGNPKGSCAEKGSQEPLRTAEGLLRERGLDGRVMANRNVLPQALHAAGPSSPSSPTHVVVRGGVDTDDLVEICAAHLEGGRPSSGSSCLTSPGSERASARARRRPFGFRSPRRCTLLSSRTKRRIGMSASFRN